MKTGRSALAPPSLHSLATELAYRVMLGLTAITDALPARLRFGHWQGVLSLLALRGGLSTVPRQPQRRKSAEPKHAERVKPDLHCLLVAGSMDGGGVESVVATLAMGLPAEGIAVEVVTTHEGRISNELRAAGVRLTRCPAIDLAGLIADRGPDVVELHRPDAGLMRALLGTEVPVVPVFHAMESYLTRDTWSVLTQLAARAPISIAVSDGVKDFFIPHLGGSRIDVVVNGVPPVPPAVADEGDRARSALGEAIGVEIPQNDVLVVGLQRYSDQKNAAGLIDAFLKAVDFEPRLRLVLAGAPDNWLEVRRADAVRRTSTHAARVHLLGDSDPQTLLRAADVYALDSFAEGGPLSAVEAVVHGLPVVLSDVGFSRTLVSSAGVRGEVVPRANTDFTQASIARERRRRHQSNRVEFSAALVRAAAISRSDDRNVPNRFTERSMVAGHAAALRDAVAGASIS